MTRLYLNRNSCSLTVLRFLLLLVSLLEGWWSDLVIRTPSRFRLYGEFFLDQSPAFETQLNSDRCNHLQTSPPSFNDIDTIVRNSLKEAVRRRRVTHPLFRRYSRAVEVAVFAPVIILEGFLGNLGIYVKDRSAGLAAISCISLKVGQELYLD